MARKRKTDEDLLLEHREAVRERISYWKDLNENGGSDPGWPDGTNMNLVRNHVIHHKRGIVEVCERNGWPPPDECYLPTPPKVSDGHMASLGQKERVERLRQYGHELTTGEIEYDESQMEMAGTSQGT